LLAFLPYVLSVLIHDWQNGFEAFRAMENMQTPGTVSSLERLYQSLRGELVDRYWSFAAFPFRLHIAVLAALAFGLGLFSRSKPTRLVAILIAIHLIFFAIVTNANKSPRYLTLIVPFLATLWAEWVISLWTNSGWSSAFSMRIRIGKMASVVLLFLVGFS